MKTAKKPMDCGACGEHACTGDDVTAWHRGVLAHWDWEEAHHVEDAAAFFCPACVADGVMDRALRREKDRLHAERIMGAFNAAALWGQEEGKHHAAAAALLLGAAHKKGMEKPDERTWAQRGLDR